MIDSLTSQLSGSREDAFQAIARLESSTSESQRYQLDAKNANANYERELVLHAEARAALQDACPGWNQNSTFARLLRPSLLLHNQTFRPKRWRENCQRRSSIKSKLMICASRIKCYMTRWLLFPWPWTSFSRLRLLLLWERGYLVMVLNKTSALPVQLGRNSFLIFMNYLDSKQSECAMLEADLASAKWALERERTAAELANRSLEEARSELKAI